MSDKQLTPEQMQALLKFASKKLGTTPDQLVKTVNEGNLSSLAPNLSPESRQKLDAFTHDQAQAEQLMQSPQVQQLIERLLGGGRTE